MKKNMQYVALTAAILPLTTTISKAAVVAEYQFLENSLANTAASTPGLTVSAFSLGNYGDLTDNGAADNLRISGDDNTDNGTGTAFANGNYLSFSVTVAAGYTMDLNSFSFDTEINQAFQYSSGRVFTSIQGFDEIAADTILFAGLSGVGGGGTDQALTTNTIDLNGGSYEGANISDADFNGITDTTVTFYIPWIDNSGSATRWADLDNVTLDATVTPIPEPSSTMLLGLGGLALLRRRK